MGILLVLIAGAILLYWHSKDFIVRHTYCRSSSWYVLELLGLFHQFGHCATAGHYFSYDVAIRVSPAKNQQTPVKLGQRPPAYTFIH